MPVDRPKAPTPEHSTSSRQVVQLPKVSNRRAVEPDATLRTFMIQVETQTVEDPVTRVQKQVRVVTVLKPEGSDLTIDEARQIAERSGRAAAFPDDFLVLDDAAFAQTRACQMLQEEIGALRDTIRGKPSFTDRIEIRADENTEFRIINFILRECGGEVNAPDRIPVIAVRVLSASN
jgi:hypothetical protein